jgi:MOSC domain-containing protein YiiM
MTQRGRLLGIATHAARQAPMDEVPAARITLERGVDDDFRGRPGRRQVTVVSREAWDQVRRELSAHDLDWTTRRANLFVEGIDLHKTTGYDLRIGDAIVSITGETLPCERMNQQYPGLLAALKPRWRAGVTARVKQGGAIAVGAEVVLSRNIVRQYSLIAFYAARKTLKRSRSFVGSFVRRMLRSQQA